jgi:hypothetical protein
MAPIEVNCGQHGRQGIGFACIHVIQAIDSGEQVGFFWGDETDTARPDAWCWECEQALLAINALNSEEDLTGQWFDDCQFKIICSSCWDLAKERQCSG